MRSIARKLDRSISTISREIRRTDAALYDALAGYVRQMKKLPAFLRQTMTYDRGSEMACHAELTTNQSASIAVHGEVKRGSNENTNGLLRQFLPKGADLSKVSQIVLNDIARLMNGRPRQTLN